MYKVILFKDHADAVGTVIHYPDGRGPTLEKGVVTQKPNGIDEFNMTVLPDNPAYGKVTPLKTIVRVYNETSGKVEFEGRAVEISETAMDSSGLLSESTVFENFLAYLHDSAQRYRELHNISIRGFLEVLIARHNDCVGTWKQFQIGHVTVTNSTDNLYRYIGYESTFDTIKDKLMDRLGGYMVYRNTGGVMYIDYLQNYGEIKNTALKVGINLIDASKSIKVDELCTRVVPLGKELEVPEMEGMSGILPRPRLGIQGVNNGVDYIDDAELVKEFGVIEQSVQYPDATTAEYLLRAGKQYLADQRTSLITWGIHAVDISVLDPRYESFEVGNYHPIDNPLISPEERLQIVEKRIDALNIQSIELIIGTEQQTLSQFQRIYREMGAKIDQMQSERDREKEQQINAQYLDGEVVAVSSENGAIDWWRWKENPPVLVVIRAVDKNGDEDSRFQENVEQCLQWRIRHAVYTESPYTKIARPAEYPDGPPVTETYTSAEGILELARKAKADPWFYALTLSEYDSSIQYEGWTKSLEKGGIPKSKVVLRTNENVMNEMPKVRSLFYAFWLENEEREPRLGYDLWLYEKTGQLPIANESSFELSKKPSKLFRETYLRKI